MRSHHALTLIETLMIMALIAIIGTVWFWSSRVTIADEAGRLASNLARLRHLAVASGDKTRDLCVGGTTGPWLLVPPHIAVTWPPRGLLFTPDGLPRTCDGGIGNTTILLEYRGRQAAVIVSSLGRVRWEPR